MVFVELFQSWRIVPSPWWELTKLIFFTAIAFVLGTLPFINNFAHLGGFVFGFMSAILFLPYITFGKWDFVRKRCMVFVTMPLLFTLLVVVLVMFYSVQNTDWCTGCEKFNCVEYHERLKCNV